MDSKIEKTTQDIIDVIGISATIKLLDAFGGNSLYIPRKVSEKHPIALVIGLIRAKSLSNIFGGEYIDTPMPNRLLFQLRRQLIRQDSKKLTISQMVRKYQYSRSYIRKILGDNIQKSIF